MDYTMSVSSIKDKKEIRLTISPSNNIEREFFNNLFGSSTATIETVPASDEIVIIVKEKSE